MQPVIPYLERRKRVLWVPLKRQVHQSCSLLSQYLHRNPARRSARGNRGSPTDNVPFLGYRPYYPSAFRKRCHPPAHQLGRVRRSDLDKLLRRYNALHNSPGVQQG